MPLRDFARFQAETDPASSPQIVATATVPPTLRMTIEAMGRGVSISMPLDLGFSQNRQGKNFNTAECFLGATPHHIDMTDKKFIQQRLKAIGLRQEDMAEIMHLDRSSVSAIVNNRQALRLAQLEPAAKMLKLSVADLLIGLGIDPGIPAIDKDLLADCLAAVMQRHGLDPAVADQMAVMASTLYAHAASDARFRAPETMTATAGILAEFAAARK